MSDNNCMKYSTTFVVPPQFADEINALSSDFDRMFNDAWLDRVDGPRLGPGRHEWHTATRPQRIRQEVMRVMPHATPGRFIRHGTTQAH